MSISSVAVPEGPIDINCILLEGYPDVVLVYQAPNSGSGTSTGGTGVTLVTTSQHRPLSATNKSVAGPYRLSC
jgi:hypothetical protein